MTEKRERKGVWRHLGHELHCIIVDEGDAASVRIALWKVTLPERAIAGNLQSGACELPLGLPAAKKEAKRGGGVGSAWVDRWQKTTNVGDGHQLAHAKPTTQTLVGRVGNLHKKGVLRATREDLFAWFEWGRIVVWGVRD